MSFGRYRRLVYELADKSALSFGAAGLLADDYDSVVRVDSIKNVQLVKRMQSAEGDASSLKRGRGSANVHFCSLRKQAGKIVSSFDGRGTTIAQGMTCE